MQGELSNIEKEHVAELLDSDAAARQQFVELAQWDTELGETIREHVEPVDNKDLLPSGKRTREHGGKKTFLLSPFATFATVTVLFILSVASCTYRDSRSYSEEKIVLYKQRAARLPRSPG